MSDGKVGFDAELRDDGARIELGLSGDLTVANAAPLRQRLLEAMEQSRDIMVKVHDDAAADVSLLQIFWAAHRTSVGRGISFRVEAAGSAFSDMLHDAGFVRRGGRAGEEGRVSCPWLAGGDHA